MLSLEELHKAMSARLAQEGLATEPDITTRRDTTRAALSFGQRFVWAHQQIAPESSAYNLCLAMTFDGEVNATALRAAFEAVVQRHEVLRTTYHTDEEGEPYQKIHEKLSPRITERDYSVLESQVADQFVADLAREAAFETFDLTQESSLRLTFVRTRVDRLVVIIVIQHIAWDGMTLPALSRDVEDFYGQALVGPVTPCALSLQVADFAEWEQDKFHAEDRAEDSDFWATRFEGEVPELHLPYDRRPVVVTERGDRCDKPLSKAADESLRRLTASQSTTAFSVFLAAYHLALQQMTGHTDIVVGTTVANRDEAGMELLIGNLSNVLPLHLRGGAGTFAELVRNTSTTITEAFRHKSYPQEAIVAAVNRATGNVGSRLFDTMVLFLHDRIQGPQLPEVHTSWELIDNGGALLPLVVETFMHEEHTDVQITYRTDVFDLATIHRLHEHIDHMLTYATPEARINDLLRLTATDHAALAQWSHGDSKPIEHVSIDAMIRSSTQQFPHRVAVVFKDREWTYHEFDQHVNQLARHLLERGVRVGDKVAVYAERSEQLPIAFAAVLRVGAVYFPVDPSYPHDRIDYMLADAGARLVIHTSRTPLVATYSLEVLNLAEEAERLAEMDAAPLADFELERPIHPLDGAYLLYTSGTTGRPKGVVVPHRGVVNHVQWMRDYLEFGEERILQKAPIGFDVSVFELVNALCTGSATVLPPPDWWQADVDALAAIIDNHQITQISLVPSIVRAFIDSGPDPSRLSSMRYVYLGGEAVPPALVQEASTFFGGTVMGLYGPTEAAMDLMHEDFVGADQGEGLQSALIGRPEWNSQVYVLDAQLRPVPPGVVGELYLAGAQLAQGYHRRPDLTAATFVACPFAEEPGARMYRTGDIARWNSRGRVEYLGRVDDQVKIRGHRVELGEIGSVLSSLPGVTAATVVTMTQEKTVLLVGYYVPEVGAGENQESEELHTENLKALLTQRLPEYMIPSALIRLNAMPLTANGKLDRKALPLPDLGNDSGRGRSLQGDAEQAVAQAMRHTLGLSPDTELAAEDDFLELGGDSISAIRMASALKKNGRAITTKELFEARTIARIAAAATLIIEKTAHSIDATEDATGWIPLTPLATMITEKTTEYDGFSLAIAVVAPPHSSFDEAKNVLRALRQRHPILRAQLAQNTDGELGYYIPEESGDVESELLNEVIIEPDAWDLSVAEAMKVQLQTIARSFNPARGHVLGGAWLRTDDHTHSRLLIVIHHFVVDGLSWRIVHDEIRQLWEGADVVELGTSVKSWNKNLKNYSSSEEVVSQLPYWVAAVENQDPLLGDRELNPDIDTVETVREVTTVLDADDTALLLSSASTAFGCDLLDLQIASLATAIRHFRSRRDRDVPTVSFTMERHGREETLFSGADLANTVGWFTTAYPSCVTVGEDLSLESSVKAVKEQLLAVPEQGIGWGLLRWMNPATRERLTEYPTPQVSFNYMGRFAEPESTTAAPVWSPAPEFGYLGGYADPNMPAPALLDINTVALANGDHVMLHASFRFPHGAIREEEVREIALLWQEGLTDLAKRLREDSHRRLTPSDVIAPDVTQKDLDRWLNAYPECVDVYPLAPMQAGLYYTALAGAADIYNVQTFIVVRGDLDVERLARAVNTALNHHPNLRTNTAVSQAGEPHMLVMDYTPIPVRERSFTHLAKEEMHINSLVNAPRDLQEFFLEDQREPFDLQKAPMIRATVAALPDNSHLLVLTMHHLLGDGWSGQLLPREIFEEYAHGGSSALGDPLVFSRFLSLIREKETASEKAWAEHLATVQPCVVAPQWTAQGDGRPAGHYFSLADDLVNGAKTVASGFGATLSVACQLAWANTLRYLTGHNEVVFGEVVSGRPAELDGVENAVGCFANTIPAAIDIRPELTWREHLATMQENRVELMEYHQYPLTSALRQVGARKLFDTMFVYQSYPSGREELISLLRETGLELTQFEGGGATDAALLLMIFPAHSLLPSDSVEAVVFFAQEAFEEHELELVETLFLQSLRALAETPDQRVGESALLTEEEEGILLMRQMWQ